jgi:tRNA U54 and U55 pseudouridine synthase Pus10
MTIEEAIKSLTATIEQQSPQAVIRVQRRSADSVSIRAYAPAAHEQPIKDATQELTLNLLIQDGLDVQVLVYDIATSLPPDQD